MSERIRVHVVQYAGCKNLTLRYTDPDTGKHRRKSADTDVMKEARKRAAVWESELNANGGRLAPRGKMLWSEFRVRYESEVVSGLADKTAMKISGVFNVLERTLPVVANGKLKELTADRISLLQTALREQGRAESTIAGHLAHLRAALQWAADMGFIAAVPKLKKLKRVRRSGGSSPMKGRPITGEEFERMLAKTADVVGVDPAEDWKHLLRGVFWSGLRLGEALQLSWEENPSGLSVDLSGRRPMLKIAAEAEKGHRDRILPIAPEFAELLLAVPEAKRRGRVFRPWTATASRPSVDHVSKTIGQIGAKAGIVVNRETKLVNERVKDPKTGKPTGATQRVLREVPKYASAHDLRRSFGERWSRRVMPPDLMVLMRHESIGTTMRFYVGRNATSTADAAWEAYERHQQNDGQGTILGTIGQEGPQDDQSPAAVSDHRACGYVRGAARI